MMQSIPMRDTGSTRGFTTVDPERQGVLVGMMRPIQPSGTQAGKFGGGESPLARARAVTRARGNPARLQPGR